MVPATVPQYFCGSIRVATKLLQYNSGITTATDPGQPGKTMNLTHLKPGDKIAISNGGNGWKHAAPQITHEILTITKTTATQIAAKHEYGYEFRFRRDDGKHIGEAYVYAVEATPERLAEHEAQVAELDRWRAASKATDDLMGKHLHQLKLTTPQLERLAAAWAEVKAMGAGEAA